MSIQITFNGQTYNSVEEMPAEIRAKYDQALQALTQNRGAAPVVNVETPSVPLPGALPQARSSNLGPIIIGFIVLLVILVVGLILLMLLSRFG